MAVELADPKRRRVFFEVFEGLPRVGPGDRSSLRRALELARPLAAEPVVLDLGCGPGQQTLFLADELQSARITAVDLHAPFLAKLERSIAARGLQERVCVREGDMAALHIEPASVDLIWCEGAAYFLGVAEALTMWRPWLAPGGVVALTEATWLRDDAPAKLRRTWAEEYPHMADVPALLALCDRCGFTVEGHFVLPEEAWWSDFYTPMEVRIADLRRRHAGDSVALAVLGECAAEIEMYRRYSEFYGYTFVVARPRP